MLKRFLHLLKIMRFLLGFRRQLILHIVAERSGEIMLTSNTFDCIIAFIVVEERFKCCMRKRIALILTVDSFTT